MFLKSLSNFQIATSSKQGRVRERSENAHDVEAEVAFEHHGASSRSRHEEVQDQADAVDDYHAHVFLPSADGTKCRDRASDQALQDVRHLDGLVDVAAEQVLKEREEYKRGRNRIDNHQRPFQADEDWILFAHVVVELANRSTRSS